MKMCRKAKHGIKNRPLPWPPTTTTLLLLLTTYNMPRSLNKPTAPLLFNPSPVQPLSSP